MKSATLQVLETTWCLGIGRKYGGFGSQGSNQVHTSVPDPICQQIPLLKTSLEANILHQEKESITGTIMLAGYQLKKLVKDCFYKLKTTTTYYLSTTISN